MWCPLEALAMVHATEPEASRFALDHVQFGRDGDNCWANASDGRMLVRLRWVSPIPIPKEAGDKFVTLVPAWALRAMRTMVRSPEMKLHSEVGARHFVEVREDSPVLRLPIAQGGVCWQATERRFPIIAEILGREDEPALATVLSSYLLRRLMRIAHAIDRHQAINFKIAAERCPARFEFESELGIRFEALLMPVTCDP